MGKPFTSIVSADFEFVNLGSDAEGGRAGLWIRGVETYYGDFANERVALLEEMGFGRRTGGHEAEEVNTP